MERLGDNEPCQCPPGEVWDNGDNKCAAYTQCEDHESYQEGDNSCIALSPSPWDCEYMSDGNCELCGYMRKEFYDEPTNRCFRC